MHKAARVSLLLAVAALTVAAAAAVYCGWYDAVANQVRAGSLEAATAARSTETAPPVSGVKGALPTGEEAVAAFKTAMSPGERFECLVDGVIELAIEEVGEQMKVPEAADAEMRRQCDQRREEARRKRRAMYVVFSQQKESQ